MRPPNVREAGVAPLRESLARAAEVGMLAGFPGAVLDDHRLGAIVETDVAEVGDRAVDREIAAVEAGSVVEHHPGRAARRLATAQPFQLARRRDLVFEFEAAQRRILARRDGDAASLEIGIGTQLPGAAPDDRRRRAVVEADIGEVRNRLVRDERPSPESVGFEERNLGRERRQDEGEQGQGEQAVQGAFHAQGSVRMAGRDASDAHLRKPGV